MKSSDEQKDFSVLSGRDARSDERHTPLPWHLDVAPNAGVDGGPYFYIEAAPGARAGMDFPRATTVVDPELGILTKEDAAFIVRACNSHDDLLKALRLLADASGGAADVCFDKCKAHGLRSHSPACEMARAAIRKAEA